MKDLKKKFKLDKVHHNNNFTFIEVIFIALTFGLVVGLLTTFIVYNVTKKTVFDSSLQDVISTYKDIVDKYYEDVDKEKLSDSAIDGMFNYIGEKYSKLLGKDDASSLTNSLTDNYKGIGIKVYKDEDVFKVYDLIKNSKAETSGLQKEDIILEINDTLLTSEMDINELSPIINSNSVVKIKVLRDEKEYTYKIKVGTVSIPVVSSKLIIDNDKRIGYIYLESFTTNASDQFRNELELLERRNIDSLIIDVRDNTGGYLSSAESIASMFIKKGKPLYSLEGKDLNKKAKDETTECREYPIVVLVNEYSASASEVLALALKESYGAIIVGTKTYGKGKVQVTSSLSDDSLIKYTAAKWYSPNGNNIDGVGIKPGINVSQNLKFILGVDGAEDYQLEKAKELLAN